MTLITRIIRDMSCNAPTSKLSLEIWISKLMNPMAWEASGEGVVLGAVSASLWV